MPKRVQNVSPKTFFLNEQHELSRGEKEGGGALPKLAPINWKARSKKLGDSLELAALGLENSADPLSGKRYFMVARPVKAVDKISNAKDKSGKSEERKLEVAVDYAADDSFVFRRLGLDLIRVNQDGSATVHAKPERIAQLTANAKGLAEAGLREQARWVTIEEFKEIPFELKIDASWFSNIASGKTIEAIVELQPLLSRIEADSVIRDLYGSLSPSEPIDRTGVDFSGRHWLSARLLRSTIRNVTSKYFSVQCIHSPLLSSLFDPDPLPVEISTSAATSGEIDADEQIENLPTVAVFDTGIPIAHRILSKYKRGAYKDPQLRTIPNGDHASKVASKIVFGDIADSNNLPLGGCRYYDVMVAKSNREIEDKYVVPSMAAVYGGAPDTRVFNFSFDNRPTSLMPAVERQASLALIQDLDNFVFSNDVLVVIAAGNAPPGQVPSSPYPNHGVDLEWSLGPWAQAYNAITCGAMVTLQGFGGLANFGWPSPFSRLGPGLVNSPKPDFGENGGNCTSRFEADPNLGVWTNDAIGNWRRQMGTSYAAPLLARSAAILMTQLQAFCEEGTNPFAVTVKSFLRLTAEYLVPPTNNEESRLWVNGFGLGRPIMRLLDPRKETSVFVWQGVLANRDDKIRVKIPVPRSWRERAKNPKLRLSLCWDPPVNAGVERLWVCRIVNAMLRPNPDSRALIGRRLHASYPAILRTYDLTRLPKNVVPEGDFWTLEIDYNEAAEYPPGTFPSEQRVAFSAELYDDDTAEGALSPQQAIQSLPESVTMTRLSVSGEIPYPVALTTGEN